ncbi:MAG: hypothetical protein AMXMBFR19_00900 [Chthonomonadaceae bacterium]|uniref:NAD/FAD-dependent oxidoreductase n=1 Tax=Candidatus Nitrosymbiomonas proteolyticus TaxID=2608984 RepID=A0A809RT03_9BACT|nr:NAD/FAD-dependent oxidoreductase [Candidatus Nitrosymbiomonas proteolyticus]HQU18154.1 FAD-dependent oxidoreductase [Fimbriimonadaceae bacterium]
MRVAVIGAGISGLAAARQLKRAGIDCVVFEKSDRVGGRVETRSLGGYVFDTGATSIAPRGRSIEPVMFDELCTEGLVQVELPIFVHSGLRASLGHASVNMLARFTYLKGNEQLPLRLSEGLDIRFDANVLRIGSLPQARYEVAGEEFDALILTPPVPITKELLASIGESRALANASYRSCLSVMLGYAKPLEGLKYHALLDPDQTHPLTWLSIESAKCPERAPEGHTAFVAQLGPRYSAMNFESEDDTIVAATISYVTRLYGKDWDQPEVAGVVRYRFSHPETTSLFESVNSKMSRVIVAGDGVYGARIEYAFESGERAASLLLKPT